MVVQPGRGPDGHRLASAGTQPGGDARALQQILAARTLTAPDDGVLYTAVVQRASTVKIIRVDADAVNGFDVGQRATQ